MLHDNHTPLAALAFDQWHPNGSTMAVVSARARVKIGPDGTQSYDPDVELVLADMFEGDPHKTPMIAVNDLIPYKPAGDVTVRGALFAKEPTEALQGRIRVHQREVAVQGCCVLNRAVIGEHMLVRHRCHEKRCCNPSHLVEGSVADNKQDDWENWAYWIDLRLL